MSTLSSRVELLRDASIRFEGYQNGEISRMLREAADIAENLRDRLQPVPAELYYVEDKSMWAQLFGTPERVARLIINCCGSDCIACLLPTDCPCYDSFGADDADYDALMEWLKGDAE